MEVGEEVAVLTAVPGARDVGGGELDTALTLRAGDELASDELAGGRVGEVLLEVLPEVLPLDLRDAPRAHRV